MNSSLEPPRTVVFALCGSWGIATGVSGLIFTVLALVNYCLLYTSDAADE